MPVSVRREGATLDTRGVRRDAQRLLAHAELRDAELSVVICNDSFIHRLNRDWRGVDSPTDVLAFAQGEGEDAGLHPEVLGDLVISADTATRQAAELAHPVARELRVLLVHGFLHLLGYDHSEAEEATEMRAAEERLLAALEDGGTGLVGRALG